MIIFNILTLFPESFISLKETGLLGKAYKNKIFDVNIINIRDYSIFQLILLMISLLVAGQEWF